MKSSVILIIPYFGRFNNYFSFFLESCRNNPTVNWLIVTNDKSTYDYPSNVNVVLSSFDELRQKIQSLFQFQISLESPYKLCDYRPLYGEVFKEYVEGYDFWGYCDNDLIFGDIRHFLTDEILEKSDKVLSRGHLSLYRNTTYMNRFVLDHTDDFYKTVYTSFQGFSFDEWGAYGIANHLKKKLPAEKFWDALPFDDLLTTASNFIPAQKRSENKSHIIYGYDNGVMTKYSLVNGEVYQEQILYAHFQKRPLEISTKNVDKYLIVPNKIIPYEEPCIELLRKMGGRKIINKQYLRIKYANLKRRIQHLFHNMH